LGPPFIVLATQNPFEFEGTYPLPESQLDRFLLRLRLGYADRTAEKEVLIRHRDGEPVNQLRPVVNASEVVALQQQVRHVQVDDSLNDYILDLIHATREHPEVYLGASTRAAIFLYRAAQALAVLEARHYVVPDDIKRMAVPVLAHRLLTKAYRQQERSDTADKIIEDILGRTAVPA
jgi:MoxR-like ATPase